MNSHRLWGHLRRVQAMVSAIMITLVCGAVGHSFPPIAQAETFNAYVDDALATTATKALEADGSGHVVTVGHLFGSNPFSGLLDEVRLYSRVLTLAEIQADRATPIVP